MSEGGALKIAESKYARNVVTKSNNLASAPLDFPTLTLKMLNLIASAVQPGDPDFKPYEFDIQQTLDIMGMKSKGNLRHIKEALSNLQLTMISVVDPETAKERQFTFLADAEYDPLGGKFTVRFSSYLKPHLLMLKNRFTSYKIINIMPLKSAYSIRLFDLCKEFEFAGKMVLKLEELRKILHFKEHEYPLYANFKSRVLLTAQRELKKYCELYFEFEEIKSSRKVTAIKFIIHRNETYQRIRDEVLNEVASIFRQYNLFPSEEELKVIVETAHEMCLSNEQLTNIAQELHTVEMFQMVKKPIRVLMSNPGSVMQDILDGKFYPMREQPAAEKKSPVKDSTFYHYKDYETYIPPEK